MKKINKYLIVIFVIILISFLVAYFLTLRVSYYQGVDYVVQKKSAPLYLKIIDFFSRHFHYKELAAEITRGCNSQEEKVLASFDWTHRNIREIPKGLPVIDDHVWNIIIRGYGTPDQYADVFTVLCNYAGIPAFFSFIKSENNQKEIPLSFVNIRNKWFVFDVYQGVYFIDYRGALAETETIKKGEYSLKQEFGLIEKDYYSQFLEDIPTIKKLGLMRSNIQSPMNRLFFEIRKRAQ